MKTRTRILLLDKDEKIYRVVKNLIDTIDNHVFEIEWIASEPTDLKQIVSQQYQIYLVNAALWIKTYPEQLQQLAILQRDLSPLVTQINPASVILLTDNPQLGMAALELGIADYWDKNELNVSVVERSLRLTLKYISIQQQLKIKTTELQKCKKTEKTIGKQEQEFKVLVDNVPDLIIRLDREGRYLYVNPIVEQASGIPSSEILGKTPKELGIPEQLADLWIQTHHTVLETGQELIIEYEYPSPEGITSGQTKVVPELNREGKIETILVIGRNITKRKQIEEALQKNEEQLRLLMDSLPVCIAYTDAQQRYQFINKNYEHCFGQKKEEIFGKTIQEVIGQKAYQAVRYNVERALKGEPVTYETTLSYQNGGTRYVLGNLIPDVGEDSQIKGYYALITDISDSKQAEEKLRYRLVLETAISLVSKELATYEQVELKRVLEILGVAVNANRVYLLRFYNSATKASMTHEWCTPYTQSKIKNFQNVDLSVSPWWIKQLKQHNGIIHASIDILFATIEESKMSSSSEQVSSGIAIPIYNQFGKLWGQIGFDSIDNKNKVWLEEDGQLLRVVGDIIYRYHERIIAQEKLRAFESLYSSIFNYYADAIFLIKVLPEGKFIYETVNPAYEQATGFSLEEVVGKTPRDIYPLNSAIQTEQWYRTCVKLKETLYYEETLELPIGRRMWRTNLVPIADSQGKIVTIQGSSRDTTEERKAIDEQIRHAKFHRLLASLTIKIRQSLQIEEILQTAVSEITTTLEADRVLFLKLTSHGTAQVIHESVVYGFPSLLNQVYTDDCFVRHYQTLYNFGQIKECSNVANAEFQTCYREFLQQALIQSYLIIPIIINQSSQESSTPVLWGLLCVQQCSYPRQWTADEIALLKQIGEQLSIALKQAQLRQQEIAQRQELARSNHDLEQFAYIVSHDLQEPLAIIASYGQLLKRHCQGQLAPKGEKYIEQMLKSVTRMRQQIEDLLQYSRVGTQKKSFQWIDCHWIIKQAIANLEVTIKKNQATIHINTPLPTLMADSSQLIQLWQNLISNAIKYHNHLLPIVKIGCQQRGDEWLFSISDNGIGIEQQYTERIFQIFQRLHTQEEYPGTGIGLAICERIVQRHGGRIWVESEFGKGSTFYFTILS